MRNIRSEVIKLRDYKFISKRNTEQIRNRKVITFLTIFLIILAIALLSTVRLASSSEPMNTIRVIVDHGDTLWSIAQANYDQSGDMRQYVYKIRKLNDLQTAMIYPGQVLHLPID